MRINNLNIVNFRGFENKHFSFDKNMTVIAGNNTTGKTTLIQAILIALGAYLNSLKGLPCDKAYRKNFSPSDVFRRYDKVSKDFIPNSENTRIEAEGELLITDNVSGNRFTRSIPANWWREFRGNRTTHSTECANDIINFANRLEKSRAAGGEEAKTIFPLVLSFGVKRIDNDYRAAQKRKARETRIEKAYKSALSETVDFKSAFDWLYRYESNLVKDKEFRGTRDALLEALTTAIPALSEIEIDSKNKEFIAKISVTNEESEYQTFENMSDGFKAIICIVAEIAYRCIELNGFLGYGAVRETPGIVVIDEIDLYLHPRWQKHILYDLNRAFPNIQFIVSTHSPFIIQSVTSKNLISLDNTTSNVDPSMKSIEEIALSVMGVDTIRGARFNQMIKTATEYYQLVKQGKKNSTEAYLVKKRLDEIELEFSDDPAYVALLRLERSSL